MTEEEIKIRCWWCGEKSISVKINPSFKDGQKVNCPLCRVKNMIKQFGQEIGTIATTDPLTSIW